MDLNVKILGPGCPRCKMLKRHTLKAVEYLTREAPDIVVKVDVVQDLSAIMEYNVLSTPVLIINDKAVAVGRVPHTQEIQDLLKAAAQGGVS